MSKHFSTTTAAHHNQPPHNLNQQTNLIRGSSSAIRKLYTTTTSSLSPSSPPTPSVTSTSSNSKISTLFQVANATNTTTSSSNTSTYMEIINNSKIMSSTNVHLLDHGYGAPILQQQQDTSNGYSSNKTQSIHQQLPQNQQRVITTSGIKSEQAITQFYKQTKRRHITSDNNNSASSSPIPYKLAKHAQSPPPASQQQQSHHQQQHHIQSRLQPQHPINQQHQQQQHHHIPSTQPQKYFNLTTNSQINNSSSKLIKHVAATAPSPVPLSGTKRTPEGNRADTSLGILTKKFVQLLEDSADGVVDLNDASRQLKVQKRRIYDITNVLEGIGILEKKAKNNIQLKFANSLVSAESKQQLEYENEELEQKENQIDNYIKQLRRELFTTQKYAYCTYNDLKSVEKFKDQIIIVIKAPPNSKLVLPDTKDPREIHLKAENNEEIHVFLCTDNSPENSPTFSDPLFNNINRLSPVIESSIKSKLGHSSSNAYPTAIRSAQRNLSKSIEDAASLTPQTSMYNSFKQEYDDSCNVSNSCNNLIKTADGNVHVDNDENNVGDVMVDNHQHSLEYNNIFPTITKPVVVKQHHHHHQHHNQQHNQDQHNLSHVNQQHHQQQQHRHGSSGGGGRSIDEYFIKQSQNSEEKINGNTLNSCSNIVNNNLINSSTSSTSSSSSSTPNGLKYDIMNYSVIKAEDMIGGGGGGHGDNDHSQNRAVGVDETNHRNINCTLEGNTIKKELQHDSVRNAFLPHSEDNLSPAMLSSDEQSFSNLYDIGTFMPIEPLETDYNFSLDHSEGLNDLFLEDLVHNLI